MLRKRITISQTQYDLAIEYGKSDNRSFSQLVVEALKQMRHRYPKDAEKYNMDRLSALEHKVDRLYRIVRRGGDIF